MASTNPDSSESALPQAPPEDRIDIGDNEGDESDGDGVNVVIEAAPEEHHREVAIAAANPKVGAQTLQELTLEQAAMLSPPATSSWAETVESEEVVEEAVEAAPEDKPRGKRWKKKNSKDQGGQDWHDHKPKHSAANTSNSNSAWKQDKAWGDHMAVSALASEVPATEEMVQVGVEQRQTNTEAVEVETETVTVVEVEVGDEMEEPEVETHAVDDEWTTVIKTRSVRKQGGGGWNKSAGTGLSKFTLKGDWSELLSHAAFFTGGVIFGCKDETYNENMSRQLLGLPRMHLAMVQGIKAKECALFLFNYNQRNLSGVFVATSNGGLNLDPQAWTGSQYAKKLMQGGKGGKKPLSPFPAQVKFEIVHQFKPMPEQRFKHIVTYKSGTNHFDFKLTPTQVKDLTNAFIMHECDIK